MPFFHLENEIWAREGDGELANTRGPLLKAKARGWLRPEVEELLRSDPTLISDSGHLLLDTHFTPAYEAPICSEVGLDLGLGSGRWHGRAVTRRGRRPGFRTEVLHGWRNRCAMCGYDGAMGRDPAGLEAAHVYWHSQGGPDTTDNGLSLCVMHHVLFDLGALGITPDMSIRVSPRFVSRSEQGDRLVYALDGRTLLDPLPRHPVPNANHVTWHERQVFKASA